MSLLIDNLTTYKSLVGFLSMQKEKLEKLSNNDRVMEMDGGSKYMDGGFN